MFFNIDKCTQNACIYWRIHDKCAQNGRRDYHTIKNKMYFIEMSMHSADTCQVKHQLDLHKLDNLLDSSTNKE